MRSLSRFVDAFLGFLRSILSREWFLLNDAGVTNFASAAVLVNAVLGFILMLIVAIKTDSFAASLVGVVWFVILLVGFWIARSFVVACGRLIEHSHTSIGGTELTDSCALLLGVLAAGLGVLGLYLAIDSSSMSPIWTFIPIAIGLAYYVSLLLNLDLINVEVKADASAGEEAISVFLLFSKAAVRLAGVAFGSLSVFGALSLIAVTYGVLSESTSAFELVGTALFGAAGVFLALYALIAPVVLYFGYLLLALFSDVCGSLIRLAPAPVRTRVAIQEPPVLLPLVEN